MPPSKPPRELQGCLPRIGGVFTIIFGSFFLVFAIGFILLGGGGGQALINQVVAGVFGIVALVIIAHGLRRLFSPQDGRNAFPSVSPATRIEDDPNFPKRAPLKQGTHGLRLLAGAPPFRTAIGCGCVALFWNGIVATIFGSIFSQGIGSDIGNLIGLLIFGGVGLVLIGATVYQVLRAFLVGNTYVEVERELVRPGEEFRVTVIQPGDFPITSALVQLVCEEVARYRRGTDTITVREEVYCHEIGSRNGLTASSSAPIAQLRVMVPLEAMHSFYASNNTIRWFIRVKLDIPGRPDVNESYDFRVLPEIVRGS